MVKVPYQSGRIGLYHQRGEPAEVFIVMSKDAIFPADLPSNGRRAEQPMIDQNDRPPRRTSSSDVSEARLRQQAIGVKLRQMFDEVVGEPVPDEFLDILRRADSNRSGDEG